MSGMTGLGMDVPGMVVLALLVHVRLAFSSYEGLHGPGVGVLALRCVSLLWCMGEVPLIDHPWLHHPGYTHPYTGTPCSRVLSLRVVRRDGIVLRAPKWHCVTLK